MVTVINLQKKIALHPRAVKNLLAKVLKKEGRPQRNKITVLFAGDSLIRKLNAKYLRKDCPTDVLAFDTAGLKDGGGLCADIVVSADTALRNAKAFRTTPAYELDLYSVHGLLHLLGYGDHSKREKKIMREKERQYVHS